ncbi:MAG: response regulator [Gemmatimonadaceae bacterium]|nr:response regulator [Gemmatimonadaceae bacterium]NUQ91899.1 response regulator [Gemmatimonadaceae bacterium]NUR21034.1 response regulator [Gemmatimonadaceae bacterium]NUS96325.1 response regulator [Gemmatimonadaceae bacterium]
MSEQLPNDIERLRELLRDYIAEREHTEDMLRDSEERYRSLIERAFYGIYRSSLDGRFLEVNPALVRMLGYDSIDELLRVDIFRDIYVDPMDRAGYIAAAERGDPLPDWVQTRWFRKDRIPITVRITVRPRYDRQGRIEYFEGIVEDVTERQRQEEMLRRSERMAGLGTTLAGVAHELNNPLTAVIGFAQILMRGARDDDERVGLETIHREATRAARIVKDLLTFARRQDGARNEHVDLNAIVEYILSTRRYALETNGVRCILHLDPAAPAVAGDPSQLEQVLLNLLVNAEHALTEALDAPVSANPEGTPRGAIGISTESDGQMVTLQVSDTGCGIAPEHLSRIWDPFWTTKVEGEGTGLGLSVVHGIVSAHGGTIEVTSDVGGGTTFIVRLPVAPPEESGRKRRPSGASTAVAESAETPLDILVIDDESSITSFLSHYLGSRGHAVLTAQSGSEALALARQSDFDVVVCDLRMPGMDGLATMRALRGMPRGERARYVLSTGANISNAINEAVDALGIDAVVPKPYDIEQLRRAVEQA